MARVAAAKLKQRERNAAWKIALEEGRVVRDVLGNLTSYPTIAMRDAALAKSGGSIVQVPAVNPRGKVVHFQDIKKAVAIGKIVAIEYASVRDGRTYRHAFRSSRPQLAVSTDGKQLLILGGGYRVTERGIEDE